MVQCRKWAILGAILLVGFAHISLSQSYVSFNVNQQQGLPSNTVYDIFQDSRGFLWVATENGLARYNGTEFTLFENSTVRSRAVSGLLEDKFGRIWCNNFFGEILFVENDTLKKLDSWEKLYEEGFPILSDMGDSLLISAPRHIYSYHYQNKQWRQLDELLSQEKMVIRNHNIDQQNEAWVCYSKDNYAFVKALSRKSPEMPVMIGNRKTNKTLFSLTTWQDKVWLLDVIGKELFEVKDSKLQSITVRYQQQLIDTRSIKNVGDSVLAFFGNQGLHLMCQNRWMDLLTGKNISSVATDREGGIWVGTLNEGLFYFPYLLTTIYAKEKHGLFTKILFDSVRNHLIGGTYNGEIKVFDRQGLVKSISLSPQKEIQSLFIDYASNTLLACSDYLYTVDLQNLKVTDKTEIVAVKHLSRVRDSLVLATSGGLYRINPTTKEKQNWLMSQRVSRIAFLPEANELWIGSQKGVMVYSYRSKKMEHWKPDSSSTSPGISAMAVLPDNQLAIGTLTDGLYLVKDRQLIRKITRQSGLPSNHIKALSYCNGKVWLGTDRGVCSYALSDQSIYILRSSKGLAGSEVYDLSVSEMGLWISHSEGLQHFSQLPQLNNVKPSIHLKQVTSDGQLVANFINEILLAPLSRQLTLVFDVSNNLKGKGSCLIRYRINGIDNDKWNETQLASPIANFLSLPSGNYTLEATAVNEDGISSVNKLSIPLIVQAPFWETSWFMILLATAILSIIFVIIYFRLKRKNELNRAVLVQQNLSQELRIAQLTSIRAQMNPHFIFNTMSLIQGKVLNGMKEEANTNIQNFSHLMRKVLDFSGKELIPLQDEIDILEKYLAIESDRLDGALDYTIEVEEQLRGEVIRIPSLLTQPFVENAIRHGLMHKTGSKKLQIEFSIDNDYLVVSIDDNGIGRKASEELNKVRRTGHTSFALDAYEKRIALINATQTRKIGLTILDKQHEYGMATGTTVIIRIPLELSTHG